MKWNLAALIIACVFLVLTIALILWDDSRDTGDAFYDAGYRDGHSAGFDRALELMGSRSDDVEDDDAVPPDD